MVVGLILTYDVVLAFRPMPAEYAVGDGETSGVHMGLGTLLMIVNVVLHLALHAVVPLLPPRRRRPAAALLQAPGPLPAVDLGLEAQRAATRRYAWLSLFSVALVDLYIFLLATGTIEDLRFF